MDSENSRNLLLAVVLSMVVLLAWQMLYVTPKLEKEEELRRQQQIEQTERQQATTPNAGEVGQGATPAPADSGAVSPSLPSAAGAPRDAVIARSERIKIDSPGISGSINLTGARIDDVVLKRHHVAADRSSPLVSLFSPAGSDKPYYAEYGWSAGTGTKAKLPNNKTQWAATGGPLAPGSPVILKWDNGEGLVFERTISIDDDYLFTVRQTVNNNSSEPVSLAPYGIIARHYTPRIDGLWIFHEGPIGVLGEDGYTYTTYSDMLDEREQKHTGTGGWLGITDKYWAATLIPDQNSAYSARFTARNQATRQSYQADYLLPTVTIQAGQSVSTQSLLFAGAKRVSLVERYNDENKIRKFDLLIDWGWFYFITKPLFYALDYFYSLIGNFGVSILIVTVLVKLLFFPLANKSYVSMGKMKKLQPEMQRLQQRYKDDRVKQQQALMELYKKEKVNPMSGCLPILVQIPVFFALYKVLFISIEMRHAPFFGWIQDLSARDPTSIFNLFGLLPYSVPDFLTIGIWPIIMGISMWVQMKLNPAPTDPVQKQVFAWMPLLFTFLLGTFPAGLVIYWTWNNVLSILQQYVIMRRQGVKIELWDNLKDSFARVKSFVGKNKSPAE